MKNLKTQKGITLIALIITIVVMLILVAVSINAVLGTGLFQVAQNAAKRTIEERDAENELAIKIGDETFGSLDEYIGNIRGVPAIGDSVNYTLKPEKPLPPNSNAMPDRIVAISEPTTIARSMETGKPIILASKNKVIAANTLKGEVIDIALVVNSASTDFLDNTVNSESDLLSYYSDGISSSASLMYPPTYSETVSDAGDYHAQSWAGIGIVGNGYITSFKSTYYGYSLENFNSWAGGFSYSSHASDHVDSYIIKLTVPLTDVI